ncbi:MAG: AI-2E family transporter [Ktedonobacterales bacterium]|nr:AI-2E family transporter [Ktedonobacterales bacterium]
MSTSAPPPAGLPAARIVSVTTRTLWQAATIAVGIVTIAVVVLKTIDILLLIFTAIVVAEGIRPIVRRMESARIPRPLGIGIVYLLLFAIMGLFGWLLASPLVDQVTNFANNAPSYFAQVQQWLQQLQTFLSGNPNIASAVQTAEAEAGNFLTQVLVGLVNVPLNVATVLFSLVVVLTMAFFWLTAVDGLKPFILNVIGEDDQSRVNVLFEDLSRRLGGFVRGVLVNMSVIGVLSGLGMWALGVPYALLLGIFAGLTEVIPYLGPYFGGGAAVLVALLTVGPLKSLEVLAVYVIIQEIEGNVLVPVVMNRTAQINPFTVVVAVLIGGSLFGIAGSILAVPLAIVVTVVAERVVAPAIKKQISSTTEAEALVTTTTETATPTVPSNPMKM